MLLHVVHPHPDSPEAKSQLRATSRVGRGEMVMFIPPQPARCHPHPQPSVLRPNTGAPADSHSDQFQTFTSRAGMGVPCSEQGTGLKQGPCGSDPGRQCKGCWEGCQGRTAGTQLTLPGTTKKPPWEKCFGVLESGQELRRWGQEVF